MLTWLLMLFANLGFQMKRGDIICNPGHTSVYGAKEFVIFPREDSEILMVFDRGKVSPVAPRLQEDSRVKLCLTAGS